MTSQVQVPQHLLDHLGEGLLIVGVRAHFGEIAQDIGVQVRPPEVDHVAGGGRAAAFR